jgi:hypothetical protein
VEKKNCIHCGKLLPLEDYYPHKAMRDGREGGCKDCRKIVRRLNNERKKERTLALDATGELKNAEKKRCTLCGYLKPTTEFSKRQDVPGGCMSRCKLCAAKMAKVYAKNKGDTMTKIEQKLEGHTSVGRKIYNVVPIEAEWSVGEIMSELRRNGVLVTKNTTIGCLKTLAESGLVTNLAGRWKRINFKEKQEPIKKDAAKIETKTEETNMVKETVDSPDKRKPIDIMLAVSEKTKNMQDNMNVMLERWRKMVDDAALEISQQIDDASADSVKLRQLQQILQSVTD